MKIVFLNGPPDSGKDVGASYIARAFGLASIKMAAPLKNAVHALVGLNNVPVDFFEETKDVPNPLFLGKTPREAYISLSEDYIKPTYGHDFFGKVALEHMKAAKGAGFVFSDCGFDQEILPIVEHFHVSSCCLLRIIRPGCNYDGDSRKYITPLPGMPYALVVNAGTQEVFFRNLRKVLESLINET